MRYGSVCSGIEAATVAWHHMGWKAQWYSEIEPFPSAVLKHHFPDVPNLGDMTKFKEWNCEPIDLLVGGTPCQSFSVAGLRKGLADPRGNLMLTFGAIANYFKPNWLVWENVPGVLSSNGGRDFGSFLWMLGELGYGFAYRVCDAQYFGVPQRRRRVFVVGCLGDWRRAAAVLFERHSLSWNSAPKRQTRQSAPSATGSSAARSWPAEITQTLDASFASKFGYEDQHIHSGESLFVPEVIGTLTAKGPGTYGMPEVDSNHILAVPIHDKATRHAGHSQDRANADGSGNGLGIGAAGDPMYTITSGDKHAVATPYSIMPMNSGKDYKARETDVAQPLMAGGPVGGNQGGDFIVQPMAFPWQSALDPIGNPSDISGTLIKNQTMAVAYQPTAIPISTQNALGRVNGRDDWPLGIYEDGDPAPTLSKSHGHAVATDIHTFSTPAIGNIVEDDLSSTMTKNTGSGGETQNPAFVVQPISDGFTRGDFYASTQETNSDSLLRRMFQEIGEEAFAKWGLGILDSLQSSEILRSALHGTELRPAPFSKRWVVWCSCGFKKDDPGWFMQSLREAGGEGCPPQGWQPSEQYIRELRAYLSELSQPGAQAKRFMYDLWKASEGSGILRNALSKIQKVWRPQLGERQPIHQDQDGRISESSQKLHGSDVPEEIPCERVLQYAQPTKQSEQAHFAVRRLTPEECEFLQGFPRGYTNIPWRNKPESPDGPRYKALGNSMAIPCMRWIGERIQAVMDIGKPPIN